jgi:polyferredoxin
MNSDEVLRLSFLCVLIIWFIIVGRLFCGKVCPVGYIQDLIYKIPFPIKIKTFGIDKYARLLKYFNVGINFLLLPVLALLGLYHMAEENNHAGPPMIIMVVLGVMLVISVIIRRPFCKYFCPVGTVSSIFNKISFYKYKILHNKCIQCGICVKKCKMNIIPYAMNNALECIRCGYCKKVCPKNAIYTGFKNKMELSNK